MNKIQIIIRSTMCVAAITGLSILSLQTTTSANEKENLSPSTYNVCAETKNSNAEVKEIQEAIIIPFYSMWTTARVNVRVAPDLESDLLGLVDFNEEVSVRPVNGNPDWFEIEYDGLTGYINGNYITDIACPSTDYEIPNHNGFKSFMPYTAITSGRQKRLQDEYAYTGIYGIRQVNNRFCVAVGTALNAEVGDYADLILEDGIVIPVIISDIKADCDTKSDNITTAANGCVSEFVVDKHMLEPEAKTHGDISYLNPTWVGKIKTIRVYEKNILNEGVQQF